MRLLMQQIQQPHAQIRLGVVKLIEFLTSTRDEVPLAASFREAVLFHLQVALLILS